MLRTFTVNRASFSCQKMATGGSPWQLVLRTGDQSCHQSVARGPGVPVAQWQIRAQSLNSRHMTRVQVLTLPLWASSRWSFRWTPCEVNGRGLVASPYSSPSPPLSWGISALENALCPARKSLAELLGTSSWMTPSSVAWGARLDLWANQVMVEMSHLLLWVTSLYAAPWEYGSHFSYCLASLVASNLPSSTDWKEAAWK